MYFITFIYFIKKCGLLSIGSMVNSVYLFTSVISFILYNNPLSSFNTLTLFPFLYLYIAIISFIRPLSFFDNRLLTLEAFYKDRFINIISVFLFFVTISLLLMKLSEISIYSLFVSENLAENYLESHEGLEDYTSGNSFGITGYLQMVQYAFGDFAFIFLGYYLVIGNRKYALLMGLTICAMIMLSLTVGTRSGLVQIIISIIFIYLVFYKLFNQKIKQFAKIFAIAVFSIVILSFSLITIGRFDNNGVKETMIYALESYTGQSMLNFNNYGLDANGIRYGDRTAPIIRKLIGLKTSTNFYERRETYSNMLIDDSYFYTFVGDFTLDYGPYIGMFILIILSVFFQKKMRPYNNGYKFSQIILLFIIYQWTVFGFTLWPYSEKMGNLKLIVSLSLYYFFRRRENRFIYSKMII